MIGLDTNVLVRLFVDDDMAQARAARAFVAERCSPSDPAYIDRVALCETVWVLTSVLGYDRARVADLIDKLLSAEGISVEDADAVHGALQVYRRRNVGFADALIGAVNRVRGCEATATFDRKAAKLDGFVQVA